MNGHTLNHSIRGWVVSCIVMILILSMLVSIPVISSTNMYTPRNQDKPDSAISQSDKQNQIFSQVSTSSNMTPTVYIDSSDTTGIVMDSMFNDGYIENVTLNGTDYTYYRFHGCGLTLDIGYPTVPVLTQILEVPYDVDITCEMLDWKLRYLISSATLPPAQPFKPDIQNATSSEFIRNDTIYSTDSYYPSSFVTIEGGDASNAVFVRGHRIVKVSLFPAAHNPIQQTIRVASEIKARLKYSYPKQIIPIPKRLYSEAFEDMLSGVIINYDPDLYYSYSNHPSSSLSDSANAYSHSISSYESSVTVDEFADYLIFTKDTYKEEVQTFADWKQKKGLRTSIVTEITLASEGLSWNANDILSYITDAYTTWASAPTYILIFGDVEIVPTFHDLPSSFPEEGGYPIATDLLYTTVDGPDLLGDLLIGRLSVDNLVDAENVIEKLLYYEQERAATEDFYSHALASSCFQDRGEDEDEVIYDGIEDRIFILTTESIRLWLEEMEGISTDYYYCTDPTYVAGKDDWSPRKYNNGNPVPEYLVNYDWRYFDDSDISKSQKVVESINEGRFLVIHRDHGESRNFYDFTRNDYGDFEGWQVPYFHTDDEMLALSNLGNYPVFFSIDCQCGWFDGETDRNVPYSTVQRSEESLCELLVRKSLSGAVAAIGASRTSFSGPNDNFLMGLVDAIWDRYRPDMNSGGLYDLGQIMQYGKIYMWQADSYFDVGPSGIDETLELFHLFGDPEMEIWTGVPDDLRVEYPEYIGSEGLQSFIVKVLNSRDDTPVDHAKVCLFKDSDVFEVGYTDPTGRVRFDIVPQTSGELTITVTKHNFIPFSNFTTVTSDGGTLTASPNVAAHEDEVTFTATSFDGLNWADIFTDFGRIADDVAIASGTLQHDWVVLDYPEGPLNVWILDDLKTRAAVTILEIEESMVRPDPYIYSQNDATTWINYPQLQHPTWDNPDIEIFDITDVTMAAPISMVIGHQYNISTTLHNDAPVIASLTKVTFKWSSDGTNWDEISSATGYPLYVNIPGNGFVYDTFDSHPWILWSPSSQGDFFLKVKVHNDLDTNHDNDEGQEILRILIGNSPVNTSFTVTNTLDKAAPVFVQIRQVGALGSSIWESQVASFDKLVLEPDESLTIPLSFVVPDDVDSGEERMFNLNIFLSDRLVGGMAIIVRKGSPSDDLITLLLIIGGAVAIGVIIAITIRLRRK